MTKAVRAAVVAAACFALAGACLVAPALAQEVAVGDSVAAPADAEAEGDANGLLNELVFLSGNASFAGVQFQVPETWAAQTSADGMAASFVSADQTCAIAVYSLRDADLPADAALSEVFAGLAAQSVADIAGTTVEPLGAGVLADGSEAYAFGIVATQDDVTYEMVEVFVPVRGGGFVFVRFVVDRSLASEEDVAAIENALATLVPVPDAGAVDVAFAAADDGLAFEVPEGIEPMGDCLWVGVQDNVTIVSAASLLAGAAAVSDAEYEMLFNLVADEFGGDVADSGVIGAQGVDVRFAMYATTVDNAPFFVTVAFAPAADDTLSCILIMCDEPATLKYGEQLRAMLATVRPA